MSTITNTTIQRSSGGRTDVQCTACDWTLPSGEHGPGTPERPGCADYTDQAMPLIKAHTDATAHRVHVTLTTFSPGVQEQSVLAFWPGGQEWAVEYRQLPAESTP